MILKNNNRVLTHIGLISVDCLIDCDLVYDGSSFVPFEIIDKKLAKLTTIKDIKQKSIICAECCVEVVNGGKIAYKNIKQINEEENIISHLSEVFKTISNPFYLHKKPKEYGSRLNKIKIPTMMDAKFSYFLGYSYGDGYAGPKSLELACSDDHPNIKTKLLDYSMDLFSISPGIQRGDGKMDKFRYNSLLLVDFLQDNNIKKQHAGDLITPIDILNSSFENMMAFYSGYFDADGYASGRKKGYSIASVDYNILKDFQLYLSLSNIISKIHSEDRSHKNWKTLHTLAITGSYSYKNLLESANESCKIVGLGHLGTRDYNNIPYTAKDLGLYPNRYSFCPRQGFLSFSTLDNFKKIGVEIDNTRILEVVRSVSNEIFDCIEIKTNTNKIWSNGYILYEDKYSN